MLSVVRHSFTPRIALTVCTELVALAALLYWFPFPLPLEESLGTDRSTSWLLTLSGGVLTAAIFQFSFWSFGLYSRESVYRGAELARSLPRAFAFGLAMFALPVGVLYLAASDSLSLEPARILTVLLGFAGFVAVSRYALLRAFGDRNHLGNVLVLGTGAATNEAIRELVQGGHGDVGHPSAVLTSEPSEVGKRIHGCDVKGTIGQIREFVMPSAIQTIVVSLSRSHETLPTEYLVQCKLAGIRILYVTEFYESLAKKVLLEGFSPVDFLYRSNLVMTKFRWFSKGLFEKAVALTLLIPGLPLMAIAALLVKVTSPGPILYRQTRMGRNHRKFTVLKFRSMVQDAEKDGASWAVQNDPRVTSWGRFMRKTRIDELPQLFNVLRGEMSFVGPRPERPQFVEQLDREIDHYAVRHLVSPGLTGWAQVAFRYGSSIEDSGEKLRYDLYYIKHMSIGFDLLIILSTIRTVLYGGGAR